MNSELIEISEKIYKTNTVKMMDKYGISVYKIENFENIPYLPSNIIGISENLENAINENAVVIGGPCLCYTEGFEKNLLIKDLVDITSPINIAKSLEKDCIIILEIDQLSILDNEIENSLDLIEWSTIVENLKKFAKNYAKKIDYEEDRLTIVCTSNENISNIVNTLINLNNNTLNKDNFYGIYSPSKNNKFPKGHKKEHQYINIIKRSMMTYLPEFSSLINKYNYESVIIAENINQICVYDKMKKLYVKNNKLHMVTHIAAPNILGERMEIGNVKNKLYVSETMEEINNKLMKASDYVLSYYSNLYKQIDDEKNYKLETSFLYIEYLKNLYMKSENINNYIRKESNV